MSPVSIFISVFFSSVFICPNIDPVKRSNNKKVERFSSCPHYFIEKIYWERSIVMPNTKCFNFVKLLVFFLGVYVCVHLMSFSEFTFNMKAEAISDFFYEIKNLFPVSPKEQYNRLLIVHIT